MKLPYKKVGLAMVAASAVVVTGAFGVAQASSDSQTDTNTKTPGTIYQVKSTPVQANSQDGNGFGGNFKMAPGQPQPHIKAVLGTKLIQPKPGTTAQESN